MADESDENEEDKRYDSDGGESDFVQVANRNTTPGKSEYARIRDANIAKNKELLNQLGIQFGFSRTLKAAEKNEKKASSSKTRTKGEGHMSKSDSIAPTTATSAATPEIMVTNGDNNVAHKVKDVLVVVGENTENLLTKEPDVPLNSNGSPLLTTLSQSFLQSDTSANGTMISAESRELSNNSGTTDIVPSASASATSTNGTTMSAESREPHFTNNSGTVDIVPSVSASATELASNPDPMEVDKEKGEEIRMDVDHEKGEEAHTSSSTNVALVAAPAWLTTLNMDIYLKECSDVKAWQGLVQSLYKFEEGNSISGVCIIICILLVIN